MAGCKNCFNGCVDIVSDQCVKYTGISYPSLGIEEGETYTLAGLERIIFNRLLEVMDGSGIIPDVGASGDNLNETIENLNQLIADLQQQANQSTGDLETLNEDYVPNCLSIGAATNTHDVVQALIDRLCNLISTVEDIVISLDDYMLVSEIDTHIAAYLSGAQNTKMYTKMVPYTVVEYYGDLTGKFDSTGAGIQGTDWEHIYLCNGNNYTPDKRGRIPIGATNGMNGGAFNQSVDPAVAGNPSYSLNATGGANFVTLSVNEMPTHSHEATSEVLDSGHTHTLKMMDKGGNHGHYDRGAVASGALNPQQAGNSLAPAVSSNQSNITVSTAVGNKGGGNAHSNIPPVLACYYIMYRP